MGLQVVGVEFLVRHAERELLLRQLRHTSRTDAWTPNARKTQELDGVIVGFAVSTSAFLQGQVPAFSFIPLVENVLHTLPVMKLSQTLTFFETILEEPCRLPKLIFVFLHRDRDREHPVQRLRVEVDQVRCVKLPSRKTFFIHSSHGVVLQSTKVAFSFRLHLIRREVIHLRRHV